MPQPRRVTIPETEPVSVGRLRPNRPATTRPHLLTRIGVTISTTNILPDAGNDPPSLTGEGPAYRMALLLGFAHPVPTRVAIRMGLIVLTTWVPLLVLSFTSGVALGDAVEVRFLRDPTVYTRYLVALPLLVLAEVVVGTALSVQSGYFIESGLIREQDQPKYQYFKAEFVRLHDSWVVQGVIVILSYVLVITMRTTLAYRPGSSSCWISGCSRGVMTTPSTTSGSGFRGVHQEKILGCPDVSSLADLAVGFAHVQAMKVMPFDRQALLLLLAAALGPMLPFFASAIPLTEILKELAEFMV
jgi:hypothetical protein